MKQRLENKVEREGKKINWFCLYGAAFTTIVGIYLGYEGINNNEGLITFTGGGLTFMGLHHLINTIGECY